MLPLLKYTVMRLALFIGGLWLFWLVTKSAVIAVTGAAVVSFLLSYLLLRGPRDELASLVANQVERRRLKDDAADLDAADEDAEVAEAAAGTVDEAPDRAKTSETTD